MKPGRHREITQEMYHADPCPTPSLSSHIATLLVERSPRHAWTAHPKLNPKYEPDQRKTFDIGKVAHTIMLGDGHRAIAITEAEDWRTKAAQESRERAYRFGQVPILRKDAERVAAMVSAGQQQLEAHADAKWSFADGAPEQVITWQEETTHGTIWCRSMLDWFPRVSRIFPDYKTTGGSAHPDAFYSAAWDNGYYVQAAFYMRGLKVACNIDVQEFRFIVQETEPPYALSVCALRPEALAEAEAVVDDAIDAWAWCLKNDNWPGYPNRVAYISVPPWVERRREAAKERAEFAISEGKNPRELMLQWQRPL